MAPSQIRQNYHQDCEVGINKQINMELYASYVYLSMAYHFERDDVALKGFYEFFKQCSDEEREHAQKLMKYQNSRGGSLRMQPVEKPNRDQWEPLQALEDALALERKVNQALLDLHVVASGHTDPHLTNYLEDEFLEEQVDSIKKFGDLITNLKRCGEGLGVFIFDKDLKS